MFAGTVFKNMLKTPIRLYFHPIPIKLGLDPVSFQEIWVNNRRKSVFRFGFGWIRNFLASSDPDPG
jgi:hypothetical protein